MIGDSQYMIDNKGLPQVWAGFSAATGYTLYLAAQKCMAPSTPRHVCLFLYPDLQYSINIPT